MSEIHSLIFNCLISIFFLHNHTTLYLQHFKGIIPSDFSVTTNIIMQHSLGYIILQKGNYFFIHGFFLLLLKISRIGITNIV